MEEQSRLIFIDTRVKYWSTTSAAHSLRIPFYDIIAEF